MNIKQPIKYLILLLSVVILSCDKEEERVTFLQGKPPVLSVSSTTDLTLIKDKFNYSSLQFQWTNPAYEFSNGLNTQAVSYTLEIDNTTGFLNSKKVEISFENSLSKSFTVGELNGQLGKLELADNVPNKFYFRLKASLPSNNAPLYSNVVNITISTYLDVVYPVPAKLFLIGGATPKGWDNTPENLVTQQFTVVNSFTYEIASVALKPDGYLMIPVAGDWSAKYGFTGAKQGNNTTGDITFKPAGEDFQGPAEGNYKMTVNFKTGKMTVTKL